MHRYVLNVVSGLLFNSAPSVAVVTFFIVTFPTTSLSIFRLKYVGVCYVQTARAHALRPDTGLLMLGSTVAAELYNMQCIRSSATCVS